MKTGQGLPRHKTVLGRKAHTHADGKEFPQQGSERECKVVQGTTRCANGKRVAKHLMPDTMGTLSSLEEPAFCAREPRTSKGVILAFGDENRPKVIFCRQSLITSP